MIYCTQINKLNMHYIAKYQYVKLLHFLRVHHVTCLTFKSWLRLTSNPAYGLTFKSGLCYAFNF